MWNRGLRHVLGCRKSGGGVCVGHCTHLACLPGCSAPERCTWAQLGKPSMGYPPRRDARHCGAHGQSDSATIAHLDGLGNSCWRNAMASIQYAWGAIPATAIVASARAGVDRLSGQPCRRLLVCCDGAWPSAWPLEHHGEPVRRLMAARAPQLGGPVAHRRRGSLGGHEELGMWGVGDGTTALITRRRGTLGTTPFLRSFRSSEPHWRLSRHEALRKGGARLPIWSRARVSGPRAEQLQHLERSGQTRPPAVARKSAPMPTPRSASSAEGSRPPASRPAPSGTAWR